MLRGRQLALYRTVDGQRLGRTDTVHLNPAMVQELLAGMSEVAGVNLTISGGARSLQLRLPRRVPC